MDQFQQQPPQQGFGQPQQPQGHDQQQGFAPPPPPGGGYGPPPPPYQQAPSNGIAVAGLICAFFFPLIGLILSIIGLSKSNSLPNRHGRGIAIAGIIISIVIIVLEIIFVILLVTVLWNWFEGLLEEILNMDFESTTAVFKVLLGF